MEISLASGRSPTMPSAPVRGRRRRRPCGWRSVRSPGRSCPPGCPRRPRRPSRSAGSRSARAQHDVGLAPSPGRPTRASARRSPRRGGGRARWSSARRSTIVSSATMPGRRDHPGLAHAAAEALPVARASAMTSAGPHSTEPTGAPRPFDTQNIDACRVARRARRRGRRARPPRSRCGRRRSERERVRARRPRATSASSAGRHGRPPAGMCVFSIVISDTAGEWYPLPATACSSASGSSDAVVVRERVGAAAPQFQAAAAASYRYTCARSAAQHLGARPGEHPRTRAGSPSSRSAM